MQKRLSASKVVVVLELLKAVAPFIFVIINIHLSTANFVCGIVHDSDNYTSSWFDVDIRYTENIEYFTTCKVSPEEKKYCCDPLSIQQVSWNIGKEVTAQVFDLDSGLFSNPVTLQISGEGFDVFPDMFLQDAISLEGMADKILFNANNISVNIK